MSRFELASRAGNRGFPVFARRIALSFLLLGASALLVTGCGDSNVKKTVGGPPPRNGFQLNFAGVPAGAGEKLEVDSVGIFFCLDTSGSMADQVGGKRKIDISKEAMRQVFAQLGTYVKANPKKKVKVGVCSFSSSSIIVQPLEPFDQTKLEQAINPLQPQGGTAIGGAMGTAVLELVKSGVESRAIIVMTDGENTAGPTPQDVMAAIRHDQNSDKIATNDIKVFVVAFDINARVFEGVKQAGAIVRESRDQKSLQGMLNAVVEEALLEAPSK